MNNSIIVAELINILHLSPVVKHTFFKDSETENLNPKETKINNSYSVTRTIKIDIPRISLCE